MRRRTFVFGALAVAVGGGAGWLSVSLRSARAGRSGADAAPDSVFPTEDRALVLAVADAIVPRDGAHPSASEIDLLPRLEGWVRSSPSRRLTYEKGWPRLKDHLQRAQWRGGADRSDGTLRRLHVRYRIAGRPPRAARFFEQMRRDVLRVYYASPEGWASLGYAGPVHRTHPLGEGEA